MAPIPRVGTAGAASTAEPTAYVFGYGSLAAMREPLRVGDRQVTPVQAVLRGFRRYWGVAMDNREAAPLDKHFVDPETREPPPVRIAFLDVDVSPGETVNGLAVPVDSERLLALDAREVNYTRVEVSSAIEPLLEGRVFVYGGKRAARERCEVPPVEPALVIDKDYWGGVRRAFSSLGSGCLAEFDRSTPRPPFPLRRLTLVRPDRAAEDVRATPSDE